MSKRDNDSLEVYFVVGILFLIFFFIGLNFYGAITFCKKNFQDEFLACLFSSKYNIGTMKR